MEQVQYDGKIGFIGGFLVTMIKSISLVNVIETVLYATIGTVISFFISMLLRYLFGRLNRK